MEECKRYNYYDCNGDTVQELLCEYGGKINEIIETFNSMPDGPRGPVGPTGPQGPIGPEGPRGPEGPQGVPGTVTFEHLTPVQLEQLRGPRGLQGLQGPQGNRGEKGEKGDRGLTGAIGPAGPQGQRGEKGELGAFVFREMKVTLPFDEWVRRLDHQTDWTLANFKGEEKPEELRLGDTIVIRGKVDNREHMIMTLIGKITQAPVSVSENKQVTVLGGSLASFINNHITEYYTRAEADSKFMQIQKGEIIEDANLFINKPNTFGYTNAQTQNIPTFPSGTTEEAKSGIILYLGGERSPESGFQIFYGMGGLKRDDNNVVGRTYTRAFRITEDLSSTSWSPWKKVANTDDFYSKSKTYNKDEINAIKNGIDNVIEQNESQHKFKHEQMQAQVNEVISNVGTFETKFDRITNELNKLTEGALTKEVAAKTYVSKTDMQKIKTVRLDGSNPDSYVSLQPAETHVLRTRIGQNDLPPEWGYGGLLVNKYEDVTLGTGTQEWTSNQSGTMYVRKVTNMKEIDGTKSLGPWYSIRTSKDTYTKAQTDDKLDDIIAQVPDKTKYVSSTKLYDQYLEEANSWTKNGFRKVSNTTGGLPTEPDDRWGTIEYIEENPGNGQTSQAGTQIYRTLDGRTWTRSLIDRTHWGKWEKVAQEKDIIKSTKKNAIDNADNWKVEGYAATNENTAGLPTWTGQEEQIYKNGTIQYIATTDNTGYQLYNATQGTQDRYLFGTYKRIWNGTSWTKWQKQMTYEQATEMFTTKEDFGQRGSTNKGYYYLPHNFCIEYKNVDLWDGSDTMYNTSYVKNILSWAMTPVYKDGWKDITLMTSRLSNTRIQIHGRHGQGHCQVHCVIFGTY